MLPRQVLHLADKAHQAPVAYAHFPLPARLRAKAKAQDLTFHFGVLHPQRGRAKAVVGANVRLIANADAASVEQPDDAGNAAVPRQYASRQFLPYPRPDQRQQSAEGRTAVELLAFPFRPEVRVVAILLAPLGIDAGRKNVSVGCGAIQRIRICWRQSDGIESLHFLAFGNPLA